MTINDPLIFYYIHLKVQEVSAESQELMRQALEDAEDEMRRKTELIQQIRAIESIPIIR